MVVLTPDCLHLLNRDYTVHFKMILNRMRIVHE